MFKMHSHSVIASLVDNFLDRSPKSIDFNDKHYPKEITRPGLLFELIGEVNDYDIGKSTCKYVYIVCTGNTSVFYLTSDDPVQNIFELHPDEDLKWINTSNHDSCWRDDGINSPLSELYFKMCSEVNPDKAPIELDSYFKFMYHTTIFKRVTVTTASTDAVDTYRRKIVRMKPTK